MKKILFVISVVLCFMNMQCEDDDYINTDLDNLLIGSWVDPTYDEGEMTFRSANALHEDGYGVSFKGNRGFVERSSGWCTASSASWATSLLKSFRASAVLEGSTLSVTRRGHPGLYPRSGKRWGSVWG